MATEWSFPAARTSRGNPIDKVVSIPSRTGFGTGPVVVFSALHDTSGCGARIEIAFVFASDSIVVLDARARVSIDP